MKTLVICPSCKKERMVENATINYNNSRNKNVSTGLCRNCYLNTKHDRPMSERPRCKHSDGYIEIHLPNNHWAKPMASNSRGGILEHRLVMAEYLGRLLLPTEIVHHINGIKDDNRIENLKLTTKQGHQLSYQDGYTKGLKEGMILRDKTLERQIKLLQWQIKQLAEQLQIKVNLFGV